MADELVWRRPHPGLLPFVTAYSGYRTDARPPTTHQGVPSGHLTLVLCLDGTVDVLETPDPARSPGSHTAMVGGLHDRPAVIAQGPAQTGVQLRLTWLGARALLGLPAGELAGDVVGLDAVVGPVAARLTEQLATAPGWRQRFAVLDRELAALAGDAGAVAPEVGHAWDRLVTSGGTLKVTDVADEVGWSRRHLGEMFRRETGLAPKAAARVIRFERAGDLLRGPQRPGLADVAHACGYADQAHLARDFRDLAGITATAWLGERPADPVGPPQPPGRPDAAVVAGR